MGSGQFHEANKLPFWKKLSIENRLRYYKWKAASDTTWDWRYTVEVQKGSKYYTFPFSPEDKPAAEDCQKWWQENGYTAEVIDETQHGTK